MRTWAAPEIFLPEVLTMKLATTSRAKLNKETYSTAKELVLTLGLLNIRYCPAILFLTGALNIATKAVYAGGV